MTLWDLGGPFQMQHWHKGAWHPMEDGAAGHHWRPTVAAQPAIDHCRAWTGSVSIPAMQVVDLSTGVVVWRDPGPYPDAGPPVGRAAAVS